MKNHTKVFANCMSAILLPFLLSAGNGTWTSIDGPPGGHCTAVDFVPPPVSDLMYASCDSFLYKSTDRGFTWQITAGHPQRYIYDIKSGNYIAGYYFFTATSDGIYRGYMGDNWQRVHDIPAEAMVLDRQACQYVYAIVNDGIIIRSTNLGDTWEEISPSVSQTGWMCMDISSPFPSTIYASHEEHGLYKSIDAGDNWQYLRFNDGWNGDTDVVDIDVSPRDQNIIFCNLYIKLPSTESEIWKSIDAGITWIRKFNQSSDSEALRHLTISIPSPDTCLLLWNGHHPFFFWKMFWSIDEGETWLQYGPDAWPSISFISHFCSSPLFDGVQAIAGEDGLAMTENFLDPYYFSYRGFKPRNMTTNLSVLLDDDAKLICNGVYNPAKAFSKLWRTIDGGTNWTIYPSSYGIGEFGFNVLHVKRVTSDRVYLILRSMAAGSTNQPDSFSISSDGGGSYTKVFQTTEDGMTLSHFDVYNENTVYLIGNGRNPNAFHLWRSDYPFSIWEERTTYEYRSGNCVRIHPFDSDTLFFGGFHWQTGADYCEFWKSTDGGAVYTPSNNGLPAYQGANNQISTLVTAYSSPGLPITLYCGLRKQTQYLNSILGIYKSTNLGDTWTDISFSPTHSVDIYELKVDHLDPSIIYGATAAGMYVTHDQGAHWTQFNQELEVTECYAVDLATNRPQVFCGTGHGVFKYTPVTLKSGLPLATAYQARKMIVKDSEIAYLAYQTPGGVYMGVSDLGGTQKQRMEGIKDGSFPALESDAGGNPCVVWARNCEFSPYIIKKGELWFSRFDGLTWTQPYCVLEFASQYGCSLYLPAITVDPSTNIAYAVFEKREKGLNGPLSTLHLVWFNITDPANHQTLLLDAVWSPLRSEYPSIAYFNDTLYMAFQQDNKVYRIRRSVSTGDTVWRRVSAVNRQSHRLFVDAEANGRLNYVWEDSTAGNIEIYSAYEYNGRLYNRNNVSNTAGKSQWPQVCKGTTYITWSECPPATGWEIFYKNIDYPANYQLTSTIAQSKYSHGIITYGITLPRLTVAWTEGDASPYELMVSSVYVNPEPAYFYVDAGTEDESPWTVQRQGYTQYGEEPEKTIDFHATELIYRFPDLKPDKRYLLKLVFYYESPGQGSRHLGINVDDILVDHVTIDPNEVKTYEQWLPETCYADNEIKLKIKKEQGAKAFVAQIMVYEYEPETEMASENSNHNTNTRSGISHETGKELFTIKPNPCPGKTTIRFLLPASNQASKISIYDAAGRLIKQYPLSSTHDQPANTILWDCTDRDNRPVASGIYFVMLGSSQKYQVRKLVVTR